MASQNDIAAAEAEFQKKFGGMGGMKPQLFLILKIRGLIAMLSVKQVS